MISLDVQTRNAKTSFAPGDTIEGTASWTFDGAVSSLDLRLFWFTEGRGEQDVMAVDARPFEAPQPQETRPFTFRVPDSPYSFSGRLITLKWALELVVQPSGEAARLEICVSPTGSPVRLRTV